MSLSTDVLSLCESIGVQINRNVQGLATIFSNSGWEVHPGGDSLSLIIAKNDDMLNGVVLQLPGGNRELAYIIQGTFRNKPFRTAGSNFTSLLQLQNDAKKTLRLSGVI